MKRIKSFRTGDDQVYVECYPRTRKHDRSDIDIFRLTLVAIDEKTGRKENQEFEFTPDEGLLIAQTITNAVMFWMMNYKPYDNTFMKRKRQLGNKMKNYYNP